MTLSDKLVIAMIIFFIIDVITSFFYFIPYRRLKAVHESYLNLRKLSLDHDFKIVKHLTDLRREDMETINNLRLEIASLHAKLIN